MEQENNTSEIKEGLIPAEEDTQEADNSEVEEPAGTQEEEACSDEADDRLYQKMCDLEELFKERIAYDEHKNALFDKLYDDKKKYENDVIASVTDPIILEVIHVIEEIRAQMKKIPGEANQENYDRLKKRFAGIPQRLEDLLYEQNVEPYSVEGDVPDMKQQKVINAVETEENDLGGKIAERLTCGYKKGNRIIKPERINVYKVKENN